MEERISHLYASFRKEIGTSRGKATRFVRFDLVYSTGASHSHPILEREKPASEKWLEEYDLDEWPGFPGLFISPTIDEEFEYTSPDIEK